MFRKIRSLIFGLTLISISGFLAFGQTPDSSTPKAEPVQPSTNNESPHAHRLLQSDEFLVETAYLEDEGEFLHKFFFRRGAHKTWSALFVEEVTLGNEKHQVVFSIPANLAGTGQEKQKGFDDANIEYSYGLYGNSESKITVTPGIGLSVPIGSFRRGRGSGGMGLSAKIPVSVMLGSRFASNSVVGVTYTKSARNPDGDRANTLDYDIGQSFVWFTKPKLNIFVEAIWERTGEVIGPRATKNEHSFILSPAVRWTHLLKNGLTISPGIAFPVGIGPSRGEKSVVFYITFAHPIKRGGD